MNSRVLIIAAFALSGCNIAERLANGSIVEPDGEVIEPNGEIVLPNGETIEPHEHVLIDELVREESDMCLVRARHFHGLVRIPCEQIAREPAP